MTNLTAAGPPSQVRLLPPEEGEGEVREPLQLLAVVGGVAEEEELLEEGALEVETLEVAEVGEIGGKEVEEEVPDLEEKERERPRVMWSAVGVERR